MRRAFGSLSSLAAVAALLAGSSARADPPPESLGADDAAFAALALALAAAPSPDPAGPAGAAVPAPRVELVTTVSARSLAFEDVPQLRVALGGGARRAVWRVERVNLPEAIAPGAVYRDVQVKLTLTATLVEFEALLEDARRLAREARLEGVARVETEPGTAAPATATPSVH